jgi:hypothetical protein
MNNRVPSSISLSPRDLYFFLPEQSLPRRMDYAPFHEQFPDIAEQETRSLTVTRETEVLAGTYLLMELYCADPDCDCRRVFLDTVSVEENETVAVIAYGWEDREYYEDWFGMDMPQMIDELKGPTLNLASPQSEYALSLLKTIEKQVLDDDAYVDRIQNHYQMFKNSIRNDR